MDCAYKNDGGGNVGFNVVDKVLDSNIFLLERNSTQVCTKGSASSPGELETVVTNGSNKLFQVECNGNKITHSEFSLDKHVILSDNNVNNETNKLDTDLNHKFTLDRPLLHEPCERTAKKGFDWEVAHQLNSVQSSQVLKDFDLNEESSGVEQGEKGAFNSQLQNQKHSDISPCVNNPSNVFNDENDPLTNPAFTNLEGDINNKECANAKLGHSFSGEIESNVVEDNQMSSDSGVNSQSVDTPFSSEIINECVSDEEVYLEVDEIGESDQVSDVASEDEEKVLADDSDSQIALDCSKTIDVLIKSIKDENPVFELLVNEPDPPALSLNTPQYPNSQDEFMSDEIYEVVEEDYEEELDLEKQDEINDSREMDVDSECVDSLTSGKLSDSTENKELKDDFVESPLDRGLNADIDSESINELKVDINEEINCNKKESEDNNGNVVKTEFAADKDLFEYPKKKPSTELKENFSFESHFKVEKHGDVDDRGDLGTVKREVSVGDNILEDLKIESRIELEGSNFEESQVIKKKNEDINENVVEETQAGEHNVIDEDEEEMIVSNDYNEPTTPTVENKDCELHNTGEEVQDDSKKVNSAMDISEVSETVCISEANADQVPIENCRVEDIIQGKMNDVVSPKKALDGDDFDEEFESLIEEFVVTECASEDVAVECASEDVATECATEDVAMESASESAATDCASKDFAKPESRKSEILLESSEDELEVIIEDFKSTISDDDCLIVEDTNKEIVINLDYESSKKTNVKSSPLKIDKAAPDATKKGEINMNLVSSNIGSNVKLKDVVDKPVSNLTMFPVSEQICVDKMNLEQQGCIEPIVDKSNTSKFGGAVPASNVGPSESRIVESISNTNINLPPKLVNKSQSDKVTENNQLCTLSNESDVALAGTKDFNDQLKNVCDLQLQPSDLDNINCQPVGHESDNKFSSVSAEDEHSDEGNNQEIEMGEIIIDTFTPPKGVTELNSSAADSREKHFNKEDSKKRMFEEIEDDQSLAVNKKFKCEEIAIEIPYDCNSEIQRDIQEKVLELIPQENSFKFVTTKKILDKIINRVLAKCLEDVRPSYVEKIVVEAEEQFQVYDEDFQLFNVQVTDLVSAQDEKFQYKNFNPQVQTRTVGVNVKIFRECDLQNYAPAVTLNQNSGQIPRTMGTSVTNKATLPVSVGKSLLNTAVPPRPNIPASSVVSRPLVQTPQLPLVRRPVAPPIVTNASRPRHVIPGQRFTSVSPNVTIAGNPLQSILTNSVANRPLAPNPGLVPNSVQAPNSNRLVDLTGDGSITRRPGGSTISSVTPSTISNTIPGLSGNQNVLVPLSNFFQMLPTTQNNTQFSTGNQLQMGGRQSVLQSSIRPAPGPRTVAYLMPSSSGQLANFGGRGGISLPPFLTTNNQRVTPFLTSGNQRLQTIVVRMTNPGQVTPLSSLVSSTPRIQAPSNSLLNTNTVTSATSGGGLVLFPRAATKHPAPFPQTPIYNMSPKLKLLPPKPTLKGSRAPQQGIILSWNINLQSCHADISNYQLFAYQETNAVVTSALWKKVGDVKALPLPMACTLTQFIEGHRYFFTVRAVDASGRFGPFSEAVTIMYSKQDDSQAASNK